MSVALNQQMYLDWLAFTWNNADDTKSKILSFLDLFPEFERMELFSAVSYGHYEKMFMANYDILIFYDSETALQDKGVNVVVPSHSIEYFCALLGVDSLKDLFILLVSRGCKFSRLDITYDDFSKRFYPIDFFNWFQAGNLRSKMKKYNFTASPTGGSTFYMGNRAGLRYLRIYDKFIESSEKNKKDPEIPIIDSIRYEFELHSYAANSFIMDYIENQSFSFKNICDSYFEIFVETDKTKQRNRCTPLPEWAEFVKDLEFCEESFSFKVHYPPKSFARSRAWFYNYCLSVAAKLFAVEPEEFLDQVKTKFIPPEFLVHYHENNLIHNSL